MRTVLAAVGLLLLLSACGTDGGRAVDPAGDPTGDPTGRASAAAMPDRIPPASGPVATGTLVTVMDTGGPGGPELCLGAVAESYPPQCRGLPMAGWNWADRQGIFEHQGDIRWGQFAVTGTFDGTTFTVRDAIPAALYDAVAPPPVTSDCPEGDNPGCTAPEGRSLEEIQAELASLPGLLTSATTKTRVDAQVVFDDGSLQAWADETYGRGVVSITSGLVPLG